MRELFLSERRVIRNILMRHCGIELRQFDSVLAEYHVLTGEPGQQNFNADFFLQFVADQALRDCVSFCAPVLPHTSGAEVFLTVSRETLCPLRTEMLGGQAFPIRYYGTYINEVESQLASLSVPLSLRTSAYLRILVVECDICFLAFQNAFTPTHVGASRNLCASAERWIACYDDASGIAAVDGWVRTNIRHREWKIIAEHRG